jgi:hypothetical protein
VGVAAHRWREQGLANHVLRQQVKERKAIADAELEHLRAKEWRASEQATWKRLLPFFQLPGTITQDATLVQVELRPFNLLSPLLRPHDIKGSLKGWLRSRLAFPHLPDDLAHFETGVAIRFQAYNSGSK